MMAFQHRIAHFFGWNAGIVWSVCDRDGRIWIGFRCTHCGDINGVHETTGIINRDDRQPPQRKQVCELKMNDVTVARMNEAIDILGWNRDMEIRGRSIDTILKTPWLRDLIVETIRKGAESDTDDKLANVIAGVFASGIELGLVMAEQHAREGGNTSALHNES